MTSGTRSLVCLLLLAGCASEPVRSTSVLPFHVAVIPVPVQAIAAELGGEGQTSELQLGFDTPDVSAAVVRSLTGGCFTAATLLGFPADVDSSEFAGRSLSAQQDHWIAAAREEGADLILLAEFRYARELRTHINDRFWLNLPLFLLGGPATWFVNDRAYDFEAALTASLYDLAPLLDETRAADLQNERSLLLEANRDVRRASLDFLQRSDKKAGRLALSLLVPAGFLAKQTDGVKRSLEQEIMTTLGHDLSQELRDRSRELLIADRLVDFHPENLRLEQAAGGQVLRGDVLLRLGEVDRMGLYRVFDAGGALLAEGRFEEGVLEVNSRGERILRHALEIPLSAVGAAECIRLELEDGSRDANRRSFSCRSASPS